MLGTHNKKTISSYLAAAGSEVCMSSSCSCSAGEWVILGWSKTTSSFSISCFHWTTESTSELFCREQSQRQRLNTFLRGWNNLIELLAYLININANLKLCCDIISICKQQLPIWRYFKCHKIPVSIYNISVCEAVILQTILCYLGLIHSYTSIGSIA